MPVHGCTAGSNRDQYRSRRNEQDSIGGRNDGERYLVPASYDREDQASDNDRDGQVGRDVGSAVIQQGRRFDPEEDRNDGPEDLFGRHA